MARFIDSGRTSWDFTGLLLVLSVVLACGDSSHGGDDTPPMPDAAPLECGGQCTGNNKCCEVAGGSFCIDTSRDIFNCGGCGHVCDTMTSTACGGSECK